MVSKKKSIIIFTFAALQIRCFSPLAYLKIFFFIFDNWQLNMIYLGVNFWHLSCFESSNLSSFGLPSIYTFHNCLSICGYSSSSFGISGAYTFYNCPSVFGYYLFFISFLCIFGSFYFSLLSLLIIFLAASIL